MSWDILTQCYPSGSIIKVLRFNGDARVLFTIPQKPDKPLVIRYRDGKNGGKISCVECDVHKTYTENVPMWAFRTTFPEGENYIIYRIYNEIHMKFTCQLYDDGSFKIACPTKMRRVPLDENGNQVNNTPKVHVIEILRQEEKFTNINDAIETAKEIKVRRNSA